MTTVVAWMGLTAVKAYRDNRAKLLASADPTLLMGLELETEGLIHAPEDMYVQGMGGERDGSLRGNAWEFITKPADYSNTVHILERFFAKNDWLNSTNYTERCSVHVHCNVQDFTLEQLKTLCITYQVVESLFYAFAGNERDANIFCVPWAETLMTVNMIKRLTGDPRHYFRSWQKYTGLNLIPISTLGTVEFRHLPGTADVSRISHWLRLISGVMAYARNVPYQESLKTITQLNTNSEYKAFTYQLFGECVDDVTTIPNWEALLQDGVLNVKYMFMGEGGHPEVADVAILPPADNQAANPFANLRRFGEAPERVWNIPRPVDLVQAEFEGQLGALVQRQQARAAQAQVAPVAPRNRNRGF
jgi:hypothetical protein